MSESSRWRSAVLQITVATSLACGVAGAQSTDKKRTSAPVAGQYVGPGSCGATACHGSVQPRSLTRVLQNEYSTWVTKDAHFKALHSLDNPVSQRMGRILGIDNPATSPKCLACHSLAVPPEEKVREFDLEGVS